MVISPELDRRNGLIFIWTQLLVYLAAPVLYVGVVQAAFCDKLGASATVANLPSSTYALGAVSPIICAWFFPARLEKVIVGRAFAIVAASMLLVCFVVFFPAPNWLRITVVIGQGMIIGILNSITNMFLFKCLARGTTEQGRTWALKYAFGFGPVTAVAGSLAAQLLLSGKIPGVPYPYNFGVLYAVALPCTVLCARLASRFRIVDVAELPRSPFWSYLMESAKAFVLDRRLIVAWLAFFLWFCTYGTMTNLSRSTRESPWAAPRWNWPAW